MFSEGASAPDQNSFAYTYDKLNRLVSGAATGMSETMSYDVMGNITSLNRMGQLILTVIPVTA